MDKLVFEIVIDGCVTDCVMDSPFS